VASSLVGLLVSDCVVSSFWMLVGTAGTGASVAFEGIMGKSIGSRGLVSLMEMTMFSRSMGMVCRLLLSEEEDSCRLNSGRACGTVTADDTASSKSSDRAESRLEESSGTGMSAVAACGCAVNELRG